MFTDSHCHLTFPELSHDLAGIRQAMAAAQVGRALCICTTLEEFPQVHSLAMEYDNFWSTVGVHPDNEGVTEPSVQDLVQRGNLSRVVAVGETGLDYYRLNGRSLADMNWQRERFRVHIRAAQILQKPLVIHTRSASDDTISILKEEGEGVCGRSAGGVFHCFTESRCRLCNVCAYIHPVVGGKAMSPRHLGVFLKTIPYRLPERVDSFDTLEST